MEERLKKGMTLGDLIVAAYQVWGADRAEKMLRWAITTRQVVLQAHPRLLISTAKRRLA